MMRDDAGGPVAETRRESAAQPPGTAIPFSATDQAQIQPVPHASLVRRLKRLLIPPGVKPRTVRGGLLRGLRLELDLQHQLQLWLGLSERELIPWFERYTASIRGAIDIGAAEGRYTIPLLARTKTERVIAVEPTPRAAGLERNLALNGIRPGDRLTIVPAFVGAEERDGVRTLDSMRGIIRFPLLVKMDVEGAEADVLRGASELLRTPEVSWIVETHSLALEKECIALFQAAGLSPHVVENARWRAWVPMKGLGPIGHGRWLAATSNPAHR